MDTKTDKRKQKRTKTRVLVKIDGKSGILSDCSENGLQIATNSLPAKKRVSIVFEFNGQQIRLDVMIQWIRKKFSSQHPLLIGCAIENAPVEYFQFVKSH